MDGSQEQELGEEVGPGHLWWLWGPQLALVVHASALLCVRGVGWLCRWSTL